MLQAGLRVFVHFESQTKVVTAAWNSLCVNLYNLERTRCLNFGNQFLPAYILLIETGSEIKCYSSNYIPADRRWKQIQNSKRSVSRINLNNSTLQDIVMHLQVLARLIRPYYWIINDWLVIADI
jgi:hypothetical protein